MSILEVVRACCLTKRTDGQRWGTGRDSKRAARAARGQQEDSKRQRTRDETGVIAKERDRERERE